MSALEEMNKILNNSKFISDKKKDDYQNKIKPNNKDITQRRWLVKDVATLEIMLDNGEILTKPQQIIMNKNNKKKVFNERKKIKNSNKQENENKEDENKEESCLKELSLEEEDYEEEDKKIKNKDELIEHVKIMYDILDSKNLSRPQDYFYSNVYKLKDKINRNIKIFLIGLQKMVVFIKIYNFRQHLVKWDI